MSQKNDVRSPEGMGVVASVGGEDQEEAVEAAHDEIRAIPRSEELHDFACGHCSQKLCDLDLYGQILKTNGRVADKCGPCWVKFFQEITCRCSLCGLVIWPGDPVALYGPSPDFKPERLTEVKSGVIGCLRIGCCPSGGFFAGHWTKDGFRPAFADGQTVVEQVFSGGKMAVVGDTGQLAEAGGAIEKPLMRELARSYRPSWFRRILDRLLRR